MNPLIFLIPIVTVSLTAVRGPESVAPTKSISVFNQVRKIYREEVGVHLRLVRVKQMSRNRNEDIHNLRDRSGIIGRWKQYLRRHPNLADINYVSLPPLIDGGTFYLAGQADGICSGRIAWGVTLKRSATGSSRLLQSRVVMAHEIGHMLGAEHEDAISIMNPGAASLVDDNGMLHFSSSSVEQIRECLGE